MLSRAAERDVDLEEVRRQPSRSLLKPLARVAAVALALTLLWVAFRNVDPSSTLAVLEKLGPNAPFLLLPSLAAVTLESRAWQLAVSVFAPRPAWSRLAHVRIVTESLGSVLPFGAVWADAIKPYLLGRHCGLRLSQSLAAIAARKYLLISSQSMYVLSAFVLGHASLFHAFDKLSGTPLLALLVPAVAALLFGLAEGMALVLRGGRAAGALLESARFFGAPRRVLLLPQLLTLLGWMLEATETWAILWLMGVRLDFSTALAVEASVVFMRHVLFVLPAGFGAQELGYSAFLGSLGVAPPECAAFVLAKRARELMWAGVGYALFVADTAQAERSGSRETARAATVSVQ